MEICANCPNDKICKRKTISCQAIEELFQIQKAESLKARTILTRFLSRKLGIRDAEPSKELQQLGEAIISRFIELHFINEYGIKVGYVISYENKCGQKIKYADCRKVSEVYKAYLPFDFVITFYYFNTEIMSENQKKILMLHELKHIQMGEKGLLVKPHDIEDFKDILGQYGLEWNEFNREVPDILGGG